MLKLKLAFVMSLGFFLLSCESKQDEKFNDEVKASVPTDGFMSEPIVSKIIPIAPHDYDAKTENNSIEILGVDWEKEKVIFKHRFTRYYEQKKPAEKQENEFDTHEQIPPAECNYPDLGGLTPLGQIIAVYDLSSDSIEKYFQTHASVKTKEECAKAEDVQQALKSVEAYLSQNEIRPSDNFKIFELPGSLSQDGQSYELSFKSEAVDSSEYEKYSFVDDSDYGAAALTRLQVFANEELIYERPHRDYRGMAAGTHIKAPMAIVEDNKMIFVEYMVHSTADQGIRSDHWYSFSPIIPWKPAD